MQKQLHKDFCLIVPPYSREEKINDYLEKGYTIAFMFVTELDGVPKERKKWATVIFNIPEKGENP